MTTANEHDESRRGHVGPAPTGSDLSPLRRRSILGIVVVSLVLAAIAGYLLSIAWIRHGLPLGCGGDSGCAEVLHSRWSELVGVPVTLPAVGLYLTAAMVAIWYYRHPDQNWPRWVLTTVALTLLAGAAWFTGLQMFVVGAWCVFCLTEHVLGLILAVLVLAVAGPPRRTAVITAAVAVGMLVLLQVFGPVRSTTITLPEHENFDSGPGPERRVALLQGRLVLDPRDEPLVGSADAPRVIGLMFDYCCPHCRRTHEYLRQAVEQLGQTFPVVGSPAESRSVPSPVAVICLPMPRDADCNPSITQTEKRFEHACELAQLALAVWIAEPSQFAAMDHWLFASEDGKPRDPTQAHSFAEQLVGGATLARALADRRIEEKISRNVRLFAKNRLEYIPVLMSPGVDTLVGRPESADALRQWVQQVWQSREDDSPSRVAR